ncbi:ABC transporter substrate-binding protein [Saccharibacillus sp. CPCC 101409]|uniref:ABC transporter substrate-binding protein n=1 Tax=Saccharibacillus sp. CPCC 101409 TaxID=3058041 RepID=UPI0026712BA6|nr:ABC transporter substrate-binding protein [Saccharibacillus sp. CPCC 101409]MDO3411314.1 ABC transporter substrate-binding protein [Saccharibacillus sp. CPCC 101409]
MKLWTRTGKTIKPLRLLAPAAALLLALTACSGGGSNGGSNAETGDSAETGGETQQLRDVSVVLDWTPNTNHTGLYAAVDQGFYKEEGLNVQILQPGAGGADQMVASGEVPFGVSYQESITQARAQNVPLVSIAAVIQHNTSGFAAPADRNIESPKDFEGKRYGGWGSPVEEAVMKSIMDREGADVGKVEFINMGDADFFTAVKRDIDFAWIFYAWTGIEAELRNEPIDMLYVKDYSDSLDYYTPVIATNEKQIADDPELVKAFMKATAEGYEYAIDHPEEAADILIKAVPDLDPELVKASQKWLSPKYQDDAAQWGWQKPEVWKNYGEWMSSQQLLEGDFDPAKAFTNDYLPAADAK